MSADAATQQPVRTIWRDDLVAALTGGLLILGLFVDGWNHLNLQNGKAGEFLTPWHGLLYAGFNACAIWAITRNARLRAMLLPSRGGASAAMRSARRPELTTAHIALAGLALAGAGVIGDAVARAAGLRADTAAMAPPFDFLLFTGAGLMFAIAVRATAASFPLVARRLAIPAVLGAGAAVAAMVAFGGQAATKTVDHVVRTVAAAPSVTQSAPRTLPQAQRAHHARPVVHRHAHRAPHHSHGATVLVAASAAGARTDHLTAAVQRTHTSHAVAVHRRAARHVSAPRHRTAARPAPHRRAAAHPHRSFKPVAIPSVPSEPTVTTQVSSNSSSPAPQTSTTPVQSPTAAPTPTTSNPPASPPATPPAAAKQGGKGPG